MLVRVSLRGTSTRAFDNVDASAARRVDGVIAEIAERAAAAFARGGDARGKVRAAVEAIVDVIESDPRTGRLIFSGHAP